MKKKEITNLVTCIEENLRASQSSGLNFVDSRHQRKRLFSKQNHIVFGRRGAGKTSLLQSVMGEGGFIAIYINLEDYKDITFPNIVIHVLDETLSCLNNTVFDTFAWWQFWRRRARDLHHNIEDKREALVELLHEPDEETRQVREKRAVQSATGIGAAGKGVKASHAKRQANMREVRRIVPRSKMAYLRLELTTYKELIDSVSQLHNGKPTLLILDDFYFMRKPIQPEFIDYFHRLTKGTALFLKLSSPTQVF